MVALILPSVLRQAMLAGAGVQFAWPSSESACCPAKLAEKDGLISSSFICIHEHGVAYKLQLTRDLGGEFDFLDAN